MATWVYTHNMSPFIIAFTENFGIRWYGMAYVLGLIITYLIALKFSQLSLTSLSEKEISSFINYGILGVLLGGRLGYCLFYNPESFSNFHSQFPFWGVLEVHKGGMASHGGIVGLALSLFIFSKRNKISPFHIFDITVIGGSLGIVFGRIANFINGELYGRIIQTKAWIGVQFPKEIYTWTSSHWNKEKLLSLKSIISKIGPVKNPLNPQENLLLTDKIWENWINSQQQFSAEVISVLNYITTSIHNRRTEMIETLSEILPIRHPSQLYQSFLEGIIPFLIVCFLWWKKPKIDGVIAGIWALSYITMRVFGEIFREPDAHIGFEALGLTRGQWLSLSLLIPIFIYFYLIHRFSKSHKA